MRLTYLAIIGLLACNKDVGKQVAPPPTSAPAPVAFTGAPSIASTGAPPVASTAGTSNHCASHPRCDGPPDCRFERPATWASGRLSWLGSCRDGFAQGSGVVLREFEEDLGLEPERFYGSVKNGYLNVGVVETSTGYSAGTWAHGALAPEMTDDIAQRNVVIHAFEVAAAAASTVSKSFAKKGDTTSSRFYAERARHLREQLD